MSTFTFFSHSNEFHTGSDEENSENSSQANLSTKLLEDIGVQPKKSHKYKEADVQQALQDIKENQVSIYRASKNFNIPETTLRDRIAGRTSGDRKKCLVLSADLEKELSAWILNLTAALVQ